MTINTDCSVASVPVHGVVEFVPADFRTQFPAFTDPPTSDVMLELYFALATQILNNSCGSVVCDAAERERLLNLLVAHIATLWPAGGAGGGGAVVGPITSASEGSVSISAGWAASVSGNAAWFLSTQWGFLFWQLTVSYRTMHYIAPAACCGPSGAWPGRRY